MCVSIAIFFSSSTSFFFFSLLLLLHCIGWHQCGIEAILHYNQWISEIPLRQHILKKENYKCPFDQQRAHMSFTFPDCFFCWLFCCCIEVTFPNTEYNTSYWLYTWVCDMLGEHFRPFNSMRPRFVGGQQWIDNGIVWTVLSSNRLYIVQLFNVNRSNKPTNQYYRLSCEFKRS